jgi:capsular polysaccharide biosynthesis protein/Mrp family chromosome partitioning ATPase
MSLSVSTDSREERGTAEGPSWINPTAEAGGIAQYLEALRGAWWLIIATVIGCVGANLVILAVSDKVYEASAYLVVSPVADRDGTLAGLSVLRETNDPARNLETLARVITTPAVAERVKAKVNVAETARSLRNSVQAVPVAQSDLVEVRAQGASPEFAQQLANAFADATIDYRTTQLHRQVATLVAGVRPLVGRGSGNSQGASQQLLADRLAQLEALGAGPDPTVRLETRAELPRTPVAPKPLLSTLVALIAGLLIGVGGVFGLQLIDPRVRSERQLRELYRLPILARIPKLKGGGFGRVQNSYQALRAGLMSAGGALGPGRTVLLTGPSGRDGKTTTAVGLARALAESGQRTALVEADTRRSSIGNVMGVSATTGLHAVMRSPALLPAALVQPEGEPSDLKVLLAEDSGDWLSDVLTPATADRLLTDLEAVSDWVVIDSPPLGQVVDALALAILAGQLLVVVRLGKSQLGELKRLAETLAQYNIRPTGFVVIA